MWSSLSFVHWDCLMQLLAMRWYSKITTSRWLHLRPAKLDDRFFIPKTLCSLSRHVRCTLGESVVRTRSLTNFKSFILPDLCKRFYKTRRSLPKKSLSYGFKEKRRPRYESRACVLRRKWDPPTRVLGLRDTECRLGVRLSRLFCPPLSLLLSWNLSFEKGKTRLFLRVERDAASIEWSDVVFVSLLQKGSLTLWCEYVETKTTTRWSARLAEANIVRYLRATM